MRKKIISMFLSFAMLFSLVTPLSLNSAAAANSPIGTDIIVNGDFSNGDSGWVHAFVEEDGFVNGDVVKNAGYVSGWVYGNQCYQPIKLVRGFTYELSAWGKSNDGEWNDIAVSHNHNQDPYIAVMYFSSTEWQHKSITFTVLNSDPDDAYLLIWADSNTFWFTDIKLVVIDGEYVIEPGDSDPVGISQVALPDKTMYYIGQQFDITGLKFHCNYENGAKVLVEATSDMVDLGGFNPNVPGKQKITVNYEGFKFDFQVKVFKRENFSVSGGRIYDPNGEEFVPIGTNVNGPKGFFTRDTLQDITLLCDVWQFNTVRMITTHGIQWQNAANADFEGIIDAFTKKGVVVMIEVHDYCGYYPDEEDHWNEIGNTVRYNVHTFRDKWVETAEMFKDNPFVWFNIMNEPDGGEYRFTNQQSCEAWYAVHKYVMEGIREIGADNIIVLDEDHYGQSAYNMNDPDGYGSAILHNGPKLNQEFDNLVYSLHPYAWRDFNRMNRYVIDCHARNLALVIGEYGAGWVGTWGPVDTTFLSTKNVYDVCIPHRVGRLYWTWHGDRFAVTDVSDPNVRAGDGYEIDRIDGTRPTNLTWFGKLVWADTRGTLTAPVWRWDEEEPIATPTPTQTPDDFTITIGAEEQGGAGVVRGITVECANGNDLDGKQLVVRVLSGEGSNAKVMVLTIDAKESALVSYTVAGSYVTVWLAGGMPNLTSGNIGVKIFATANS